MESRRREFLAMGAVAAVPVAPAFPRADFGRLKVSRLIVGGNPVSGNSHSSRALDREMADYFTAANIKQLLRNCEQSGIDTWQSRADRFILRMLREYRNEGGRIQWIAQTASELADINRNIGDIAAAGAIGAYHHGTKTDQLWAAGKIEEVRERLKVMRDAGLRAGVGTHIPEVVDWIESKGWDVDFYMTCLYNLSQGDSFQESGREPMLERVRRTSRQCLIFKVYGAGRRCRSEEDRRAAVKQAFASAKRDDCVVIGMFPKYSEQVAENCRLVRECIPSA